MAARKPNRGGAEQSRADLESMGAPPEYIDKVCAQDESEDVFELWQENVPVIEWFSEISTQWRVGGIGNIIGLDYNAIDVDARFSGREVSKAMWADLKIVERAFLSETNKQVKKDG